MAAALVIVALVGCATHAADGSWVVTRIATAEGDLVEAESSFLLEFHDGEISGESPCNTFHGQGEWPGSSSTLSVSSRACSSPSDFDALFLSHLQCTAQIEVTGDVLTTHHADGSVMLILERPLD